MSICIRPHGPQMHKRDKGDTYCTLIEIDDSGMNWMTEGLISMEFHGATCLEKPNLPGVRRLWLLLGLVMNGLIYEVSTNEPGLESTEGEQDWIRNK